MLRNSERRGWQRVSVFAAGAGLIVGIAGSRLVLNVHSALEVGIGFLIGSVTLALFASRYLRLEFEEKSLRPLILPAIAVVTLPTGTSSAPRASCTLSAAISMLVATLAAEDRAPRYMAG